MNNDLLPETTVIKSRPENTSDYRQKFPQPQVDVGLTELLGGRRTQEDNVSVTPLQNFTKLSNDERKKFWQDSFAEMANQVASHENAKDVGSCAIACVSYVKQEKNKNYACVSTANLGDSSVFVAVRNKATGKITVERINQDLHHAGDKDEITRINKILDKHKKKFPNKAAEDEYYRKGEAAILLSGGQVAALHSDGSMNGVAITRSFGDLEYNYREQDSVISTHPAILKDEKKFELSDKEEVYIITACDGFTEKPVNTAQTTYNVKSGETKGADAKLVETLLTDVLKANPGASSDIIAQKLAEAARDRCGSGDNISVIVRQMSKDSSPVMTAVFDGHGGEQISKFVAERFPSIAQKKLEEGLRLQTSPPHKKQKSSFNPSAPAFDFDEPPPLLSPKTAPSQTTQTNITSTGIMQEGSPHKKNDKKLDQLLENRDKAREFAQSQPDKANSIDQVLNFYLAKAKKQHPNAVESFDKLVETYKKDQNDEAKNYIDIKADQIKKSFNAITSVTPNENVERKIIPKSH